MIQTEKRNNISIVTHISIVNSFVFKMYDFGIKRNNDGNHNNSLYNVVGQTAPAPVQR